MDKKVIKAKVEKSLPEIISRIQQIEAQLGKLNSHRLDTDAAKVNVKNVIYPGSEIVIGNEVRRIKDPVEFATFKKSDDGIIYVSYEA
jgi:uncharacterized protein (DUF342 family)